MLLQRGHAKSGLRRFTLGNIDVFTTWQGTVVYAVVIGFSLLGINRQQQDLALRNSLSLEPVRADVERSTVARTWRVQISASPPCGPWNRFSNARPRSGLSWCAVP